MNRQDCLRGTEVAPFPVPQSQDTPKNVPSPSPHPYIEMRMVMMPKRGRRALPVDLPSHHRYPSPTSVGKTYSSTLAGVALGLFPVV